MCGIVGILSSNRNVISNNELEKFTNSLEHRGPEKLGIYLDEEKYLGLGHRMLNIYGLNEMSSQPMLYTHKNRHLAITFNGSIYNYIELKEELKSKGYNFTSKSDTEIILASYLEWGKSCVKKFNGIWAFALWDKNKKNLFLSRDRFGVKPLYYMSKNNKFYFASELKSFLYINSEFKQNINHSHFLYLSKNWHNHSYVNNYSTFLNNVKELKPGSNLTLDLNLKYENDCWWSTLKNIPEVSSNQKEQISNFKRLFLDSCKLRMRSDAKIGATLSGGLDSSSIVCSINHMNEENLNNFKLSTFMYKYSNSSSSVLEEKYSKKIIEKTKFENHILTLDDKKDYTNDLIKIIYHKEDIDGDDGLGPWNLYKFIKTQNMKVVIEGHGSDELLGGYKGYIINALQECNSIKEFNYKIDLMFTNIKNKIPFSDFKNFQNVIINFLKKRINTMLNNEQNINFFVNDKINYQRSDLPNADNLSPLNKELYLDFHYKSLQTNLRRFDRLSMAHGLESRSPFLDWKLVTYCFSLPAKQKISGGQNKKILREAMIGIVPEKILKRGFKTGFHMDNSLFNKVTYSLINDIILSKDFQEIPIFNKKEILRSINNKKFKSFDLRKLFKYIQIYFLYKKFSQKL